ncbi:MULTISPECIES: ferritin-like domain-containing protein [Hymenobacter]|uniref:Ferritin-like domain-containing protein n=1 Tax=Hymenobacter mucosus TaxID=1411120 RepID=A0A238WAW8_9BACT|nr:MULTISPECIES: ferritin-like domain-containing protein [Hymenobacter]SNR43531.1 Ferritin-like domain-containing protein [Hymenobacter mucosus]
MQFLKLLAQLAELDEQQLTATGPRRTALSRLGQAGAAVLPAALTALASPAAARDIKDTRTPLDVLTLALTLEYLENEFYSRALGLTPGGPANPTAFFVSAENKAAIETIQRHEQQHVTLLSRLIVDAGGTVPPAPRFDFTGSKNGAQAAVFADVYTNLDTFLQVAQLLEDAGVRAYKGQVEFIQSYDSLLEAALRTHSTEARHASHIRTMRRQRGANVKSWVSPSDTPITTAGSGPNKAYAGEENITQYVPTTTTIKRVPFEQGLPINVATPALSQSAILAKVAEAFDEPIDAATSVELAQLFIY